MNGDQGGVLWRASAIVAVHLLLCRTLRVPGPQAAREEIHISGAGVRRRAFPIWGLFLLFHPDAGGAGRVGAVCRVARVYRQSVAGGRLPGVCAQIPIGHGPGLRVAGGGADAGENRRAQLSDAGWRPALRDRNQRRAGGRPDHPGSDYADSDGRPTLHALRNLRLDRLVLGATRQEARGGGGRRGRGARDVTPFLRLGYQEARGMQKRRMARWVDGRQGLEEKSETPHISSNELRTSFVTTRHQHAPSRLGVAYACRSRTVRDWGVGSVETLPQAGEDGGVPCVRAAPR